MEPELNSKFSSVNSQISKGTDRNMSYIQKNREGNLKRQQNKQQIIEEAAQQEKSKKVDIRKLIEMKQARQLKQKGNQPKQKAECDKFFQKTNHPSIESCILCGYIIFTSNKEAKQPMKLFHMKKIHSQYSGISKDNVSTQDNNDQYLTIAAELVNFAKNKQNKEEMQYIFGQYEPEIFKPYTQYLPVSKDMQKIAKTVQYVYRLAQ